MTDKSDNDWKTKAAIGAAVGSAAVAAALLFAKRRKDRNEGRARLTGKTPIYPPETD